jgi:rhamnosyltransferase
MSEALLEEGRGAERAEGVVIVLSSYNGGRFIAQQIESLQRQTVAEWTLLVRDDGSTDDTVQIVERLALGDPRIVLLRDWNGNIGPARSFGLLLEQAWSLGARYVALADQDDVWLQDKLERELALLRLGEAELGEATPLLVHSDLTVVDESLRPIASSFFALQGLWPVSEGALGKLLFQNFVTGCTAVINRPLLRASLPFPPIIMHDWWLALCAASMGQIRRLPDPTVLYRQHGRNMLGSQDWRRVLRATLLHPLDWWRRSSRLFTQAIDQGCELARRVEHQSQETGVRYQSLAALRDFSAAFQGQGGTIGRFRAVRRHGIVPRSLLPYHLCFYTRVLLDVRLAPADAHLGGTDSSTAHPTVLGGRVPSRLTSEE